jgi:hypothetical protein
VREDPHIAGGCQQTALGAASLRKGDPGSVPLEQPLRERLQLISC